MKNTKKQTPKDKHLDYQISNNFNVNEFALNGISDIQLFLLKHLINDLVQPIRDFLDCPIKISSGVRDLSDHYKIKDQGLNPSSTSDHFYGNAVPTPNDKMPIFGESYYFSVGAADMVPNCNVTNAFDKLVSQCIKYDDGTIGMKFLNENVRIGQMIHEKHDTEWIHIANHPSIIYSKEFIKTYLNRPVIEQSLDGKTYTTINI